MNKVVLGDEFHIVQKNTRIAFLELEIQKIKAGITKAASKEILNDNIDVLHELAQTLLSKEKINEKEFRSIIDKYVSRPEKEPYKSEILRKENDKLLKLLANTLLDKETLNKENPRVALLNIGSENGIHLSARLCAR